MWRPGLGNSLETAGLRVQGDGSVGLSLQDSNNRPRVNLSVSADGSPYLSFYDENEKLSGALEGSRRATRLVLTDKTAAVRLAMATLSDGRPVILLLDKRGKERARLMILADGSPSLAVFDEDGNVMWSTP
jgi:hypothetical protein